MEIDITVVDYNDNPPVMATPLVSTVLVDEVRIFITCNSLTLIAHTPYWPQCAVRGEPLTTVSATDSVDVGDNAEVAYEVVSGTRDLCEHKHIPQA